MLNCIYELLMMSKKMEKVKIAIFKEALSEFEVIADLGFKIVN